MATKKQIAANRRNGKKSGGPKTIAGKILSARNSIKYGIFCQDIFPLPWENAASFDLMHARVLDDLQPHGARECFLVEHIFGLMWRVQRAGIAEAGVLAYRVREVDGHGARPYAKLIPIVKLPDHSGGKTANEFDPDPGGFWVGTPVLPEGPSPQPSVADIGQAHILDVQEGDALSKVRRHETSLENSLLRALRELERLQEKRIAATPLLYAATRPLYVDLENTDVSAPETAKDCSGSDGKAA
jgi:hypothetical protein